MNLEQLYKEAGGNIDEIMQRIPDRALLSKLVRMFVNDPSKESLDKAIEAGDPVETFKAVHSLKGVTLSLGFDKLAGPCKDLTENVRAGKFNEGWEDQYRLLCEEYDRLVEAIKNNKD